MVGGMIGPVGVGDAEEDDEVTVVETGADVFGAASLDVLGAEVLTTLLDADVATAANEYTFNRFPAPQYSLLLPAHTMLHWLIGAIAADAASLSPQ